MVDAIKGKKYYKYAVDVINGKIVACEFIKLACQRFIADLDRDDLTFDYKRVDRFIKFTGILKHFKSSASGKHFILEPWQQFIAANIIGFYWKDGLRRYTNSLICVSRKQGKTALAAAFCLWFLIGDGEDGAEVDLAANSRQQASLAFEFCENFARQLDPRSKDLKLYRNGITLKANASKLNVFASDSTKLDGFNASFALIDEYHAAKNSKLYDVLKSSMGQRRQPHLMVISTVGFDLTSPFYKLYQTDVEILQGVKQDDSTFVAIYSLDEGDDWTDEKNWPKIAPNLNVTVNEKYLREQVTQAKNNVSAEVGVLTKNFNVWCSTSDVWIPDMYINKCTAKVDLNDFNEDDYSVVGVDLGSVDDMTAATYLLIKENDPDKFYFKTFYFLPESALIESPNRELYKQWKRTKQLFITNGNVTDYDYITNQLVKEYDRLMMRRIAYDNWNATQWSIKATELGLPLEPFSQAIGNFNKPTKEMERLIKSGKAVIDDNEITRWMFRNVALKIDHNGNSKPSKGYGLTKKIDGIISMITALGKYLEKPRFGGGITSI